jgi:hypothetical protein
MSVAAIAVTCTVFLGLLSAGALVARAVRAWAAEVAALRQEIAALRIDMERARGADRIEVHTLIADAIKSHKAECPASLHQVVADAVKRRS